MAFLITLLHNLIFIVLPYIIPCIFHFFILIWLLSREWLFTRIFFIKQFLFTAYYRYQAFTNNLKKNASSFRIIYIVFSLFTSKMRKSKNTKIRQRWFLSSLRVCAFWSRKNENATWRNSSTIKTQVLDDEMFKKSSSLIHGGISFILKSYHVNQNLHHVPEIFYS